MLLGHRIPGGRSLLWSDLEQVLDFDQLSDPSSGALQSSTSPPFPSRTVPGKTRRRQGVSRSAAKDSAVGPPDHIGTIAGSYVTEGIVRRGATVRVVRDGTVIQETSISQLKRFKDDVREVAEGFECGILLEGFNDVKEGDVLEVYETRQIERTDLSEAPTAPAPAG